MARWREYTSGLTRCCDLCQAFFSTRTTPPDRTSEMEMTRIQTGELYCMWSVEASQLVALGAELACEIILRHRRKRGIVTPLANLPWYNRNWEMMQMTNTIMKPSLDSRPVVGGQVTHALWEAPDASQRAVHFPDTSHSRAQEVCHQSDYFPSLTLLSLRPDTTIIDA